jgi:carboxyl-terminal processing protease
MRTATKVIAGIAAAVILISMGFIGGFAIARLDYFQKSPTAVALGVAKSDFSSKIDEVEALLKTQALDPPSETSATAGAIQGLLDSNGDKYAFYFDKKHFKAFSDQTMGTFGGIGVSLGENKNGQTYVIEVYPDTPAARAGIKPGDIFHSIDGTTQPKWSQDMVVKLVRGEVGTKVKLTMTRPNKDPNKPSSEVSFTITRDEINYPNTTTKMYGQVGYVRMGQFNANSAADMEKDIKELSGKGAKALVFDLRDNPGGLLDQAVDVCSLFVEDGVMVRVDERNKPEELHYATGHKITDMPVVLLVDDGSASASEIVAGALQDYNRATLLGVKTYGKGSVQTVVKLTDGSGVKFTIAHYLTPKKRSINGVGVTPNIIVPMDPMKQMDPKTDVQLTKAIAVAKEKIK